MTRRHPVRPRRNRIAAAAATVATLTSLALLHAASPVFWRVSTQAELLRGEDEHVSIDADGRLTLGPQTELLHEASAPFLWSLARAGGALWIGSGNDGRVLRVGDDGAVTTAYEAAEQNVHAIAPDNAGRLLAGTSPEGALYRIGPEPAEMVFDPEDRYIWAVAASESGDVFVATGDQGRIYRIPAGGDAQLFYDAEASHVLALAFDAAGNLLAGTGTPGQVIRIAQDGRGFVILDSPYAEIRALRPAGDGALYAVAVGRSPVRTQSTPAAPAPARAPVPRVTTSTTVTAVVGAAPPPVPAASTPAPATASPGAARGAVYRIQPDGVWDTVWESQRDTPYDVALDPGGRLIIGTGNRGRIYAVSDDPPRVALLARAPAEQITSLATGPDGSHYYATSNPGAVYRLSTATASSGTYVSEVHDANTVAAWGALHWHAVTPAASAVRFFSRSGNTAAPSDTWSAWVRPLHRSRRLTDDQPQVAVPAVEGRAERRRRCADPAVGHRRLPAQKPAAQDRDADRARSGRRIPAAVRQRGSAACRPRRRRPGARRRGQRRRQRLERQRRDPPGHVGAPGLSQGPAHHTVDGKRPEQRPAAVRPVVPRGG